MTTSTHKYGWNGTSCPIRARKENDTFVKRVNRVLKKLGQPEVSNIGDASLEILYDVNRNHHVDYIVNELKNCRSLGYTVNETVKRLAEELKK
jgi:hypothetical protein